jgi:hypothetical protein
MINLLSRDEQKKIYREYLLRIGTLVFFVLGLIGAIFILVLVPSHMRLQSEITLVESELKIKQAQMATDDQGQVAEAKEFMREIQILRSSGASSSTIELFEHIIMLKPARVSLSAFQYETAEGKKKLSIRGKADRREDLQEFKANLEGKGGFMGINLPAQTLIKRTDIQFSMDFSVGQSGVNVTPQQSAPENAAIPINL